LQKYGFDRPRVISSIFANNSVVKVLPLEEDISTVNICVVLMLNFVELSKMGSLQLLRLLQETPSEARGVGFESSSIKWGFLLIGINICRIDFV